MRALRAQRRMLLLLALLVAMSGGALVASPLQAAGLALLVMASDADPDSVPRSSLAMRRVLDGIVVQLAGRDLEVFGEVACMDVQAPVKSSARRSDEAVIALARGCAEPAIVGQRPRAPLDALVLVKVFREIEPRSHGMRFGIEVRVEVRVIAIRTTQTLDGHTHPAPHSTETFNKSECDERCIDKHAGHTTEKLAGPIADRLLGRLVAFDKVDGDGCTARTRAYFVNLMGCDAREIERLSGALHAARCFRHLLSLRQTGSYTPFYLSMHAGEGDVERLVRGTVGEIGRFEKSATGYAITCLARR